VFENRKRGLTVRKALALISVLLCIASTACGYRLALVPTDETTMPTEEVPVSCIPATEAPRTPTPIATITPTYSPSPLPTETPLTNTSQALWFTVDEFLAGLSSCFYDEDINLQLEKSSNTHDRFPIIYEARYNGSLTDTYIGFVLSESGTSELCVYGNIDNAGVFAVLAIDAIRVIKQCDFITARDFFQNEIACDNSQIQTQNESKTFALQQDNIIYAYYIEMSNLMFWVQADNYPVATDRPSVPTAQPSTPQPTNTLKPTASSTVNYRDVDPGDDAFACAVSAAKIVVKDKLKSPSTAKFPWGFDEYTVKRSGNDFIVGGYVDAENSFGARLRQEFVATFTLSSVSLDDSSDITNVYVIFN